MAIYFPVFSHYYENYIENRKMTSLTSITHYVYEHKIIGWSGPPYPCLGITKEYS